MINSGGRAMRVHSALAYLAVLIYAGCALAACARFPGEYSPFRHWLSELGNPVQNPDGAASYNPGVLLTGLLVLMGAGRWPGHGCRGHAFGDIPGGNDPGMADRRVVPGLSGAAESIREGDGAGRPLEVHV